MKRTYPSALVVIAATLLLPGFCGAQGVALVGGLLRETQLAPGGRGAGKVVVRNISTKPQRLRVYQTDYEFTADGKVVYGKPGQAPRSNAHWMTFAPTTLEIPVGGQDAVDYTITVPNDAKLVGTYWSVLMLEVLGAEDEAPGAAGKQPRAGVRTVMRYGIQMITQIGDTGSRDLRYLKAGMTSKGDGRVLQIDLANTGERGLTPTVWAELYDEKGVLAGRFEGGKQRFYPGCSVRFELAVKRVAPGKYKALVVADNGDENVFGTQYQLDLR